MFYALRVRGGLERSGEVDDRTDSQGRMPRNSLSQAGHQVAQKFESHFFGNALCMNVYIYIYD